MTACVCPSLPVFAHHRLRMNACPSTPAHGCLRPCASSCPEGSPLGKLSAWEALRLSFFAQHAGGSHLMLVHGVLEGRDVLEGHLEEARHVEPGRQLEVVRAGVLDKLGEMKMESGFRFDRLVVQI